MNRSAHDKLILIKQDRILLFISLAIYILLFCYGLFLFLNWFLGWGYVFTRRGRELDPKNEADFGILVILFSVPKSLILIRDIFSPKVVFAYNDDGFCLRNGEFFIPWSDVSDVVLKNKKRLSKYKEKVIALKFNSEHIFVGSLPIFCKFMYFIRKMIYGYGILICLEDTDGSLTAADIFQIFVKKCPQAVYIK